MILYGRDLSPFTRRVVIWCGLQGRALERRELSAFGPEFESIRGVNPVGRVPALVLDDGTVLIESWAICDWLDETAPEGRRLAPEAGPARRDCLQRVALANSVVEKGVALVYERNRRPEQYHWPEWQERIVGQVQAGLAELEGRVPAEGWSGAHGPEDGPDGGPDGGDVAAIVAFQFLEVMNPWLLEPGYSRLAALAERGMRIEAIAATKPAA